MREITSLAELTALVGEPNAVVAAKVRTELDELDRRWLAASPLVMIATADADGNCDVSPKGDPAGATLVLDAHTIAVADRPGNRRVDGFHNILVNPHVGLLFLVPGRGDTLRVNGRARLISDAGWFDQLEVNGHRPTLALLVEIDEVFYHCSKAFLRSELWRPESWKPDAVDSRAKISKALERTEERLEDLEVYYGPEYASRLYS